MKSFNNPELESACGPICNPIILFVEEQQYAAKLLSDAQRLCAFNLAIEPSRGRSSMAQPARAECGVHPIPVYLAVPGAVAERLVAAQGGPAGSPSACGERVEQGGYQHVAYG